MSTKYKRDQYGVLITSCLKFVEECISTCLGKVDLFLLLYFLN